MFCKVKQATHFQLLKQLRIYGARGSQVSGEIYQCTEIELGRIHNFSKFHFSKQNYYEYFRSRFCSIDTDHIGLPIFDQGLVAKLMKD